MNEFLAIRNAVQVVSVVRDGERAKRGTAMRGLDVIPSGSVILRDGRVAWVGPDAQLPGLPAGTEVIDASRKVVLPGFVDSHTHLVSAGMREDEFEQRLEGCTYQEIAARGG